MTKPVLEYIKKKQLSWQGHMKKINENMLVKNICEVKIQKNRGRKRPIEEYLTVNKSYS